MPQQPTVQIKEEFFDGHGGRHAIFRLYRDGDFVIGGQSLEQTERRLSSLEQNEWRYLDCYERGHPSPLEWIAYVREQGWTFDACCNLEVGNDGRTFFGGNIVEYSAAFRYLILDSTIVEKVKALAPEIPIVLGF